MKCSQNNANWHCAQPHFRVLLSTACSADNISKVLEWCETHPEINRFLSAAHCGYIMRERGLFFGSSQEMGPHMYLLPCLCYKKHWLKGSTYNCLVFELIFLISKDLVIHVFNIIFNGMLIYIMWLATLKTRRS